MWTLKSFVPFDFQKTESNSLKGQTVFISGASRGIGLEIAKRCAMDGANIVIAAKTVTPQATLEGTIYTAAKEIEALGAKCLPL
jgi:citronellol/citronellal dehydrogenase